MTHTARPIDERTVAAKIKEIIHQQHIMTLATTSAGIPWAAPVYYAVLDESLYFFSNPDARHIQNVLDSKAAACAIYEDADAWIDIRGLQISGTINAVPAGRQAGRAVHAYLKRFPTIRHIFKTTAPIELGHFYRKFHARLYRFTPETITYTDNRIRFGFKTEISADRIVQ